MKRAQRLSDNYHITLKPQNQCPPQTQFRDHFRFDATCFEQDTEVLFD